MDHFKYSNGKLFAENVDVEKIADEVGTPAYIYSKATFTEHLKKFKRPTPRLRLQFASRSRHAAI